MNKRKIIIIGKNYVSLLTMAKSLKNCDCEIIVYSTASKQSNKIKELLKCIVYGKGIDASSKFIDKYIKIEKNESKIISSLIKNYSNEIKKPIIIPVDDYSVSILDSNYEKLSKYLIIPNIEGKQNKINALLVKDIQKELATKNGLCVTNGIVIKKTNGKYIIPDKLNYPVFTKPEISLRGNKTFIKKCENKEELQNLLETIPNEFDCPIIIEDYIQIEKEYAILGFSYNGEVFIPGIIEMLKSGNGPQIGVTMIGKTYKSNEHEELISKIANLVKETKLNGLFDVDIFKANNKYFFSELNLRFGASGYAITKAGVNIPQIYVKKILDEKVDLQNNIKEKTFANEKVLLDELINKYITYEEYKNFLKNVDFGFINDSEDSKPYSCFLRNLFVQRIKLKFHDIKK